MKNLAIVIPTLNEEENIEKLVKQIKKQLPKATILIVDDSKNKKIEKILVKKKLKAKYFHRTNGFGRGSAVLYGLKKAIKLKKNFFIEMDADFSHNPNELKRNINIFNRRKLDLLIASRYLDKSKISNWSISRRIISELANFLAKILLQIPVKDYTNGFRIYSKKSVEIILSNCGKIGDGFIILSEILLYLYPFNCKIGETNTIFLNRTRGASSVNMKLVFQSFLGLLKLYKIKKKLRIKKD